MRSLLTIFILLISVFSFAQKKKTGDPFVKPLPVHAIENKLDSPGVDVQSAVSPPATPPPAQQQSTYDPQFRGVTSPGMGPELIVFGLIIGFAILIIYVARAMAKNNGGWYSRDGYRNRGLGFDDSYSRNEYKNAFSIFKISDWSSGSNSSSRSSGGSSSSDSGSSSSSSSSSSDSYSGGSSNGGGASGSW